MIVFLFVRSEPVAWDQWGLVMGLSEKLPTNNPYFSPRTADVLHLDISKSSLTCGLTLTS